MAPILAALLSVACLANYVSAASLLGRSRAWLPKTSRDGDVSDALKSPANDSADATISRPSLRLTFELLLNSSEGGLQRVSADGERLALAVRSVPASKAESTAEGPQDGSIVGFGRGERFMHERFFDELVCYQVDVSPQVSAAPANVSFLGAVGEVFGAPLDLYHESVATGNASVAGQPCGLWTTNKNWSINLADAVGDQALGGLTNMLRSASADRGQAVPTWFLNTFLRDANVSASIKKSSVSLESAEYFFAFNATFCVSEKGVLLGANSHRTVDVQFTDSEGTMVVPLMNAIAHTRATSAPSSEPQASVFNATFGVAGGRCVDLTSGKRGEAELNASVNDDERLEYINRDAKGWWEAAPYDQWEGMRVKELRFALGAEIQPLKLPRSSAASPDRSFSLRTTRSLPDDFDSRSHWPECLSIGRVRNQGSCGSCWAVSATSVLADRFCVAARQRVDARTAHAAGANGTAAFLLQDVVQGALSFSAEHLIECDTTNHGCGGGRLDDVWKYFNESGVPLESCKPYRHCAHPMEQKCFHKGASDETDGGDPSQGTSRVCSATCSSGEGMGLYRVTQAYAVAAPADVLSMQRELLQRGPVQVAFFVFSDFQSYRRGVYFRTPGAYGPLGGHAVKLVGWGSMPVNNGTADYWLAANSWSPSWGLGGFFKIRRGSNECGIESTPAAGTPDLD